MTKIMKGGIAYNSTANMVALTQAEYNSLSSAQKNNGNFYMQGILEKLGYKRNSG